MSTAVQDNRPLQIFISGVAPNQLRATSLQATESMSQLFRFRVGVISDRGKEVTFDQVLGKDASVRLELPKNQERFFSGIISRIAQGETTERYTHFELEIVPKFWTFTKKTQSRIFQHKHIPDILKEVLRGLDVEFQLQGAFQPRDYVVQYRESDFNFASRLMEEEGIFYFFKHAKGKHTMVVANTPSVYPSVPGESTIVFKAMRQADTNGEENIYAMSKSQELAPGKFLLWDHCFELPHKKLDAEKPLTDSVTLGSATIKLKLGENSNLEIYDWPGAYAQRFDGIDRNGGERPAELQKIFQDNKRTVEIRMEEAASNSLAAEGESNCRNLVPGHKLTVKTLGSDQLSQSMKADGAYVLSSVTHIARLGSAYETGPGAGFEYRNQFTALPANMPYRPARTTPKPVVAGSQTAVVVGPPGEEIFTDKYGRVKVQMHWDRQGQSNADSSCWIRVGSPWAGKGWGMVHIPRIGQEVIVDFLEGDPDQPIIVGSVYNASQMPAYKLPDHKTRSWLKTCSTPGGNGFNEIRIEDKKGSEQIFIHGEKDQDIRIKNDCREWIGRDRHMIIKRDLRERIERDRDEKVKGNHTEEIEKDAQYKVGGNVDIQILKDKKELIQGTSDVLIQKDQTEETTGTVSQTIGKDLQQVVKGSHGMDVGQESHLKAGQAIVLEAGTEITLCVGGNFIKIDPTGVTIQGTLVKINSGGAPGKGKGTKAKAVQKAKEAKPRKPDEADNSTSGQISAPF